jgi:Lrp/AsnC family leucine-responsive transcriptional regulator
MDDLDRKILTLLSQNARMPVKDIAEQVSLTSPAVSSRIHRMEQEGLIGGYTVQLKRPADHTYIDALISLSINPSFRDELLAMLETQREVLRCYHVTGDHSFLIMVSCSSMEDLEHIIMRFQKLGQTNTQIILSTPVDRSGIETLLL